MQIIFDLFHRVFKIIMVSLVLCYSFLLACAKKKDANKWFRQSVLHSVSVVLHDRIKLVAVEREKEKKPK